MATEMAHRYHGKVIPFSQMNMIKTRSKFLESKEYEKIEGMIQNQKPIYCLPAHMREWSSYSKTGERKYAILLYGILMDGRKVAVSLTGIDVYFDIRLPDGKRKGSKLGPINNQPRNQFIEKIINILTKEVGKEPISHEIILGKPFKVYQDHESEYLRLYFNDTKTRKAYIKACQSRNYQTAHDDLNNYYMVACRDHCITLSSWMHINNYTINSMKCFKSDITTITVSINNVKPYTGEMTKEFLKDKSLSACWDIETYSPTRGIPEPCNKDDRMFCISVTFQFVHDTDQLLRVAFVDVPSAAHPDYLTIVCGCERNLILGFGIIIGKMMPEFITGFNDFSYDWPWLVERAERYTGLLPQIASKMDCFQGKHGYDTTSVLKWKYRDIRVKLEAGKSAEGKTLQLDGYIPVDVRTEYRKLYPTAEKSSLKYFLQQNNLGSKEDMPYQRMFGIYEKMLDMTTEHNIIWDNKGTSTQFEFIDGSDELKASYESLLNEMAEVNKYCVIDSQRCHELMRKRNVINNSREMSNLSFTSLTDAFYRANGVKVRNLTIAVARKHPFNLRVSNIGPDPSQVEKDKFPGAYVVPPEKGLKTSKLSIQERIKIANEHTDLLDDNTNNIITKVHQKYKSWLNVSKEEVAIANEIIDDFGPILDEKELYAAEEKYGKLSPCVKEFFIEKTGRPITGLDFSSLYPSLIRAYNFSPEYWIPSKKKADIHRRKHPNDRLTHVKFPFAGRTIEGWFIFHDNKMDITKPDFRFGIYPHVLDDLFNKRKAMKKLMKPFVKEIEEMDHKGAAYIEANREHYDDITFKRNYYNSKQLALKVFMNTYYGEAGNKISSFCVLALAGGVTSYGQYNIKLTQRRAEELGCNVVYGDTDSFYSSMPEKEFLQLDKDYYTGRITKLEYWTKQVEITFKVVQVIRDEVNTLLYETTNTKFLVMAYEEVLYPVAFLAKKKYFGIPHEDLVNFTPPRSATNLLKGLFVRGLEVKKRGVSELLRKIFSDIMWKAVDMNNTYPLIELALQTIDHIYDTRWDFTDFIETDVYKPNKQNVKMQTFAARMRAAGTPIPANERVSYVVTKKYPYKYNERGCAKPLNVGDKIELVDIAQKENLEIDIDHYMKGSIVGQLARLVTYHDMFHVEPASLDASDIKVAEDKIMLNAKKFINSYTSQYYDKYAKFGRAYRKIYGIAKKQVKNLMSAYDPINSGILNARNIVRSDKTSQEAQLIDSAKFIEWLQYSAKKQAEKITKNHGEEYIKQQCKGMKPKQKTMCIKKLQLLYYGKLPGMTNYLTDVIKAYEARKRCLIKKARQIEQLFIPVYNLYKKTIADTSDIIKAYLNIENIIKNVEFTEEKDYTLDDLGIQISGQVDAYAYANATQNLQELLTNPTAMEILNKYKHIYVNYVSMEVCKIQCEERVKALKLLEDKKHGMIVPPIEQSDRYEIDVSGLDL